jgi:hypothetical protein
MVAARATIGALPIIAYLRVTQAIDFQQRRLLSLT